MADKILIIRRDNIGDLVCTTPLIASLRKHYPQARIDALVNSYNVAVLAHNPHLDHVYAYTKAKHRAAQQSLSSHCWQRWALYCKLLAQRYDYVILADNGYNRRLAGMARRLLPRHIVGFTPDGRAYAAIDHPQPIPSHPLHCVEILAHLLSSFGIQEAPAQLVLQADPMQAQRIKHQLESTPWYRPDMKLVGLHISARKPSQRWPAQRFVALAQGLHEQRACGFLLFWSPGDEQHAQHPGDDRKAAEIIRQLAKFALLPCPTQELAELIGGLSLIDVMICADGGAMHLAAALDKPIVCFFGHSDARVWHPWQVPFELLQPASRQVADISVDQAVSAALKLIEPAQGETSSDVSRDVSRYNCI